MNNIFSNSARIGHLEAGEVVEILTGDVGLKFQLSSGMMPTLTKSTPLQRKQGRPDLHKQTQQSSFYPTIQSV